MAKKRIHITESQLYGIIEETLLEHTAGGNYNVGTWPVRKTEIIDRGKTFTAEDLYQILCNDYMPDLQILKKRCYDMFKQGYTFDMACLGIQKTYAFKNLVKTQFRHLVNSGLMAKDQTLNQAYRLVSNTIASWAAKRYQEEAMEKYYAKKEKELQAQNNKDRKGKRRKWSR